MEITSKTLGPQDIANALRPVTAAYGYNVIWTAEAISGTRLRLRIQVADSYAAGSRTSASGRHGRWACWHVFRDALAAIFAADGDAKVYTAFETYKGADGFLALFPYTAHRNAGSLIQPARFASLCECSGSDAEPHGGKFVTTLL